MRCTEIRFALMVMMLALFTMAPAPASGGQHADDALLRELLAQIQLLRDQVQRLETRVAALEGKLAGSAGGGTATTPPPAPAPVMKLERIESFRPFTMKSEEAHAARKKADELEVEAKGLRDEAATKRDEPKPMGWWYWDNDRQDDWELDRRRTIQDLKDRALEREREAKSLRGEATRLDREAETEHQRLIGWDGQRTVVLETTRDCGHLLREIRPGSFIRWRGEVREVNGSETKWDVSSFEVAAQPDNFALRDVQRADRE